MGVETPRPAGQEGHVLSHSLAVVLWGSDLIVSGIEEGGQILHQISEMVKKTTVTAE